MQTSNSQSPPENSGVSHTSELSLGRFFRSVTFSSGLLALFTLPWRNTINVNHLGSIGRYVGLVFVLSWICYKMVYDRTFVYSSYVAALCVFVSMYTISTLWSSYPAVSFNASFRFVTIALFLVAAWDTFGNVAAIKRGMYALVAGGWLAFALTFVVFLFNYDPTSGIRYAPPGIMVNRIGGFFALLLSVAIFLFKSDYEPGDMRIKNALTLLYVPAGVLGIVLSASRTAVVAALPVGALLLRTAFRNEESPFRPAHVFVAGGILGVISVPFDPFSEERLAYISSIPSAVLAGDLSGRMEIWRASVSVALDSYRNLILGTGSETFKYLEIKPDPVVGKSAHSSFFAIFGDLGLVGLGLFAVVVAIVVRAALNTRYPLELSLMVAIWMILSFGNTWQLSVISWLLCTFIVRLHLSQRNSQPNATTG